MQRDYVGKLQDLKVMTADTGCPAGCSNQSIACCSYSSDSLIQPGSCCLWSGQQVCLAESLIVDLLSFFYTLCTAEGKYVIKPNWKELNWTDLIAIQYRVFKTFFVKIFVCIKVTLVTLVISDYLYYCILNNCTAANISRESGIIGMLTGQPEVMGVTFQRPAAPPPIVSGTTTGAQPIGTMENHTGNEHLHSQMASKDCFLCFLWSRKCYLSTTT